VKHILVVGHYGCGGVAASIDGQRHGLIDHWLHPIRQTYRENAADLEGLEGKAMLNRLVELNVLQQVRNVASDVIVQQAWADGQTLAVHGWVYSLANGLVTDLETTVRNQADYEALMADKL
jgi:carbonic anhydrase